MKAIVARSHGDLCQSRVFNSFNLLAAAAALGEFFLRRADLCFRKAAICCPVCEITSTRASINFILPVNIALPVPRQEI